MASSSSSCYPFIPGPSGSKRTRTCGGPGAAREEAMARESAAVKREVKSESEEDDAAAAAWPRPMEGLGEVGPAPFVAKTYEMVSEAATDAVVSWAAPDGRGDSFVVWDPHTLAAAVLPRFFKHANFASFVRQLNTYGFRKVNPDRWEFANEAFVASQKHLLKNIKRRRASKHQMESQLRNGTSVCYGQPEYLSEVQNFKRDRAALAAEVITLKQKYSRCKSLLTAMEQRVLNNERKQQQIIAFFAKALSNPAFVQQILLKYTTRKELGGTAKRQRLMENEEHHADVPLSKGVEVASFVNEAGISAGGSDGGAATKQEQMLMWNDQNVGSTCDDVWEELDAIPGTEMEQEDEADMLLGVEEFTGGRPCGWVDDCSYLLEPMQFVEH